MAPQAASLFQFLVDRMDWQVKKYAPGRYRKDTPQ
jgi:hypothetical protein